MLRTPFSILLLATLAACTSPGDHAGNTPTSAAPQISFVITSDFAEDSAWLESYLHDVAGALVRLMDSPNVMPPATIRVEVLRDARGHRLRQRHVAQGGPPPLDRRSRNG